MYKLLIINGEPFWYKVHDTDTDLYKRKITVHDHFPFDLLEYFFNIKKPCSIDYEFYGTVWINIENIKLPPDVVKKKLIDTIQQIENDKIKRREREEMLRYIETE